MVCAYSGRGVSGSGPLVVSWFLDLAQIRSAHGWSYRCEIWIVLAAVPRIRDRTVTPRLPTFHTNCRNRMRPSSGVCVPCHQVAEAKEAVTIWAPYPLNHHGLCVEATGERVDLDSNPFPRESSLRLSQDRLLFHARGCETPPSP